MVAVSPAVVLALENSPVAGQSSTASVNKPVAVLAPEQPLSLRAIRNAWVPIRVYAEPLDVGIPPPARIVEDFHAPRNRTPIGDARGRATLPGARAGFGRILARVLETTPHAPALG